MSETTAPAVSRQATRALQVANHVRRERAKLKTRIANGDLAAADIILSSPHEIDTMPVAQLLASQRGWGQTRSRAALLRLGVREDKRIGSLTARQRNAIASLLDRQRPPRRDQRAVTAPRERRAIPPEQVARLP